MAKFVRDRKPGPRVMLTVRQTGVVFIVVEQQEFAGFSDVFELTVVCVPEVATLDQNEWRFGCDNCQWVDGRRKTELTHYGVCLVSRTDLAVFSFFPVVISCHV